MAKAIKHPNGDTDDISRKEEREKKMIWSLQCFRFSPGTCEGVSRVINCVLYRMYTNYVSQMIRKSERTRKTTRGESCDTMPDLMQPRQCGPGIKYSCRSRVGRELFAPALDMDPPYSQRYPVFYLIWPYCTRVQYGLQ